MQPMHQSDSSTTTLRAPARHAPRSIAAVSTSGTMSLGDSADGRAFTALRRWYRRSLAERLRRRYPVQ